MRTGPVIGLAAAALLALGPVARAEVTIQSLVRAQAASGVRAGILNGVLGRPELSAIVELPEGEQTSDVQRIGKRFGVVRGSLDALDALGAAHPAWRMTWSAPLRPLLDRVAVSTGAPSFRNTTGLSGRGAVVGIVDTGADITHPDLQNDDGSTRIAYFVDYSRGPAGFQKDAESQCTTKLPCAIYSAKDIDGLLARGKGSSIPPDAIGHGTHVASLAAGDGGAEKRYVGIAPEASIIVARVLDPSNQISDATVLSAANLVFYLADQLGKPAVVNLSLGSNFGPHDGNSALERGLASLVEDQKGRAIVVAAGNSAGQFDANFGYPVPLGVHTDVAVTPGSSVVVPVLAPPPAMAGETVSGSIFVWASFRPGDDVSVAVQGTNGDLAPMQHPGQGGTFGSEGKLTATVVDGSLGKLGLGLPDENAAAVIIEGTWPRDETFSLRFEGQGSVGLWADSAGDVGPDGGGIGALFPASTKESTMTIPAGNPALIAVGATLNRTTWTDRLGDRVTVSTFGSSKDPTLDSVAFFSSAGPTTDLRMKPDILAPGAFVVGAMSSDADPRRSSLSIFAESGTCMPAADCAVVDATHAVTLGTSMAAPIITGALALLFEQDPTRSWLEALTLLQAGAQRPRGAVPYPSQVGAGVLSLPGTLDVEDVEATKTIREPAPGQTFLSVGATYAHPDPSWAVPILLQLRDASGRIADGFDEKQLSIDVKRGNVTSKLARAAAGLYRFSVAANRETGGEELSIAATYGGRVLAAESIPIGVDVSTVRQGFAARGGCGITRTGDGRATALFVAACLLIARRSKRCSRVARTARNPGRMDTSARDRRGSSRPR